MAFIPRDELQRLALDKLADAGLLQEHGRSANAYYLAGYAVEFALKACIARRFEANSFPDRKFVSGIFSHRLDDLIGPADLAGELARRRDSEPEFDRRWTVARDWDVESRYAAPTASQAAAMLDAVGDPEFGVLPWIRRYW